MGRCLATLELPTHDSTQMIESDEQFFARPVQVEAHFQWDRSCTFVVLNDALVNIPTFLTDGSIQIIVLCGFDTVILQS